MWIEEWLFVLKLHLRTIFQIYNIISYLFYTSEFIILLILKMWSQGARGGIKNSRSVHAVAWNVIAGGSQ